MGELRVRAQPRDRAAERFVRLSDWPSRLFASGHAVDVVLAVMLAEAAWLVSRGRRAADVVSMLLPGALMMLALRAALVGAAWPWIALWLALSFPAHVVDVRRRVGRVRSGP